MIKNISSFNSEILIINYIFNNFNYSNTIFLILNKNDFFFDFSKSKFIKKKFFYKMKYFDEKNLFSNLKNLIEKSKKRKILNLIFNISYDILYYNNININIFEKIKKIFLLKNNNIFIKNNYYNLLKKHLFFNNNLLLSGIEQLDYYLNGFQKGDFIIIAGRPSIGKTSFALNIIKNMFFLNKKIIIFSLEMSIFQIFTRFISIILEINQNSFKINNFNINDFKKISFLIKKFDFENLIIKDCSFLSIFDVENFLIFNLKKNNKIDVVLIDYIQLMKSENLMNNRVLEISEISRALKLLAKKYNCIIITLSQLNRLIEYRNEKFPILSDLKDSGSIEQDSDIVIFLYKNIKNLKDQINISISKNRNGSLGNFKLKFINEYTKFYKI